MLLCQGGCDGYVLVHAVGGVGRWMGQENGPLMLNVIEPAH